MIGAHLDYSCIAQPLLTPFAYRGSKTTSVLANLHSDRFIGFGFLAVGYIAPSESWGLEHLRETSLKYLGRETFGYWYELQFSQRFTCPLSNQVSDREFFTAPDAPAVIKAHVDSYLDILYTRDTRLWITNMCTTGGIRVFIESDTRTPRVTFVPDELWQLYKAEISKNGLDHQLNYYRQATSEISAEDDKSER